VRTGHVAVIMSYLNVHNISSHSIGCLREMASFFDGGRDWQLLTPREGAALLARHGEGNACLARTYLARREGRLFNDMTVPDDGGDDKTLSSVAQALAIFIDDIHAALTSRDDPRLNEPAKMVEGSSPVVSRSIVDRSGDLPDAFREMSDEAWLDVLLQTTKRQEVQGFRFPRYPDVIAHSGLSGSCSGMFAASTKRRT
jgi:hypothetical protein